jgi:hypothetical protein
MLLCVRRLRTARLTLGAVLARFGVLVRMDAEALTLTFGSTDVTLAGTLVFPKDDLGEALTHSSSPARPR